MPVEATGANQTYTFDETAALDACVESLKEVYFAVFTAEMLPAELASWGRRLYPEGCPEFAGGLAKLRLEPRAKLTAWLTGKADWLCVSEGRFELALIGLRPPEGGS